jgi:hypothetical protein
VRRLAAALFLLAIGCGSSPVARPTASTISSPTVSPTATATAAATPSAAPAQTLYAVLEAPAQNAQNTTVAIAGLDGYARAKTHFTPRSYPYAPDVAVVLAPEAHVVAGVVYYVDGRGVVRTLDRAGHVRQVAVFPLTQKQQEISFAVSPDGKHLVASILTLPAVGKLIPGTGWHELVGPWKLRVDRADAGGPTTTLHQWQSTSEPGCTAATCPGKPAGLTNIVMAGWDVQGPVAVVGSNFATQNPQFDHQTFFGGHFAHIDLSTGNPGTAFGGCQGDYQPWSVAVDGTTVCAASRNANVGLSASVSVQSPGRPVWEPVLPAKPPFGLPGSFSLSLDGNLLAMDGAVVSRSGPTLALNESFQPQGWLDRGTLIGVQLNQADPNKSDGMAYLRLSNPTHPVLLGFVGEFVGTIS